MTVGSNTTLHAWWCSALLLLFWCAPADAQTTTKPREEKFRCIVDVWDASHQKISTARVRIQIENTGEVVELKTDSVKKNFYTDSACTGPITLLVDAPNYIAREQKAIIRDDERNQKFKVYLGRPGDSYTYFDGLLYPFTANRQEIIACISPGAEEQLKQLSRKLGLNCLQTPGDVPNMWLLSHPKGFKHRNSNTLKTIRSQQFVICAGPVFIQNRRIQGFFDGAMQIKLKTSTAPHQFEAEIKKRGLRILQNDNDSDYRVQVPDHMGYGINAIMQELDALGMIAWMQAEVYPIYTVPRN